ncbi:uncharacterized protein MONOS_14811 [Monocercomonoides exilis]|uniref:uncharacterized protein n=1 Tax=Monocercomonoides exilis TaxID=2049356 RepID=UPI003559423B|nr:hypothetical protein MONOS_14811 [Monocercomonoides exilis]|eukprot:MONOS_14811.1-p1 / transcript=MONOS_14811.1 / gene=MONOS_14811 / organism=Monocercomonoides_exilis_PA203 / gene_product=unspecified product / transcript_product=unspecified product / location=Mono_scaffold01077:16033-16855(-) / protein_length=144 / sequence_SO=supercontig / SO=protein_coding / is_pseudo=false
MDRACEQVEKYLFPEFKAILQSIQNIRRKADTAEEVAREALILVAQALQEARRKRIQGRFGYSASKKMEGEVTGGQLTKRHQDILEETRLRLIRLGANASWFNRHEKEALRRRSEEDGATHTSKFSEQDFLNQEEVWSLEPDP